MAVGVERALHRAAVGGEQRLLDQRHLPAHPRGERLEVRHHRVLEEPFEVGDPLELLHVQRVGRPPAATASENDLAPCPSGEGARAAGSARRSGWRTLSLASLRADRPRDTTARARTISASSASSSASASTAGQSARCTDSVVSREVPVELVGHERRERCEQQCHRRQALVQRGVRSGVVGLPEARA